MGRSTPKRKKEATMNQNAKQFDPNDSGLAMTEAAPNHDQVQRKNWVDKNAEIPMAILKHHCRICKKPGTKNLNECIRKGHKVACTIHPTSYNDPKTMCVRCEDEHRRLRNEKHDEHERARLAAEVTEQLRLEVIATAAKRIQEEKEAEKRAERAEQKVRKAEAARVQRELQAQNSAAKLAKKISTEQIQAEKAPRMKYGPMLRARYAQEKLLKEQGLWVPPPVPEFLDDKINVDQQIAAFVAIAAEEHKPLDYKHKLDFFDRHMHWWFYAMLRSACTKALRLNPPGSKNLTEVLADVDSIVVECERHLD